MGPGSENVPHPIRCFKENVFRKNSNSKIQTPENWTFRKSAGLRSAFCYSVVRDFRAKGSFTVLRKMPSNDLFFGFSLMRGSHVLLQRGHNFSTLPPRRRIR